MVPPIEELDLVGPMQVFSAANRLAGKKIYALEIATTGRELKVEGEGGILSFLAQSSLKDLKGPIDSILLVCSIGTRLTRDDQLSAWLRKACHGASPWWRVREYVHHGRSRNTERQARYVALEVRKRTRAGFIHR